MVSESFPTDFQEDSSKKILLFGPNYGKNGDGVQSVMN